jgi:8-oxo-dGTP pyrophosphatase MutT (NUDIX family)
MAEPSGYTESVDAQPAHASRHVSVFRRLLRRSIPAMTAWPTQVLATGVLVWDENGRLLMVKTHNRPTLIMPGGLVEAGESPAVAGQREVREEVGLNVSAGRLLAVQHLEAECEKPSSALRVRQRAACGITDADAAEGGDRRCPLARTRGRACPPWGSRSAPPTCGAARTLRWTDRVPRLH